MSTILPINSSLNQNNDVINSEFFHRISQQKLRLNQIYDSELQLQQTTKHFLTLINKIDQLIDEYQNHNDTFDLIVHKQIFSEEPNQNLDIDYNHSYARSNENDQVPIKKSTILQLKRFKYEDGCPLTTRTYGLDPLKHGIRHFPCTRITAPINLYKHLVQYHQLTHTSTMQIVRLLADKHEENDIDLFSSQSTSLIATHPTIYRAQCPLNQYGKFGITQEHRIRLCTQPNQPIGAPLNTPKDVCLYDHFVVYHQMKRSCAQRLAEAIVKNQTEPVFRSDEQLLNETFYIQCPLKNPKTICWKSPISTRHMGQHLTGIHKLDRIQRRQIMLTLRKKSSSQLNKSSFIRMSLLNKNECEHRTTIVVDDDDDDDELNSADEKEEEFDILEQVQGLFSTDIYPNVIDMFRTYQPKFDLIEFLKTHKITSQYDYIRLINYIRSEKPSIDELKQLKTSPWINDKYFETVIDNDPALQFDIEDDLNQLGDIKITEKSNDENSQLAQAHERIRQLEEMIDTMKSMTSRLLDDQSSKSPTTSKSKTRDDIQDDGYFETYSHYDIHKEMLQDTIRTESYLQAIKNNVDKFRDKIVLDVGCGTGILSMAAVKYGQAKMVIAVDMSDMIYDAMAIAKENNFDESKIVFIHGRIEDVKLPVDKVDIIISEWMGYFLLFECMLESIIYARNTYLDKENGLVLPDDFSIHLAGFHSERLYQEHIGYWSDVYGFEMNIVAKNILADGHVMIVPAEDISTSDCCIKTLDAYTCLNSDIAFTHSFTIQALKSGSISGFVCHFDTNFAKNLTEKVYFSTSPQAPPTHWKQTVFFLPRIYNLNEGEEINGKIICQRHPQEKRGLIVYLHVFDSKFKYYLE